MLQKTNSNCSSMLDEYKEDIRKMIKSLFSEADSLKFLTLLNTKDKNALLNSSQINATLKVNQEIKLPVVINTDDCKLPKLEGNCSNPIERVYYDSLSEKCLIFAYSGCNGNANNFETIEKCQNMCMKKTIELADPITQLADKNETLEKPKNQV